VTVDVARLRLRNQLLAARAATPEEVVGWLGAVQAQDYIGAKWGVALRTRGCGDGDIERALAAARIVRTHVLRPTWHFVLAEDLRWLLALTAPRVKQLMAYNDRRVGLDARAHGRAQDAMRAALAGKTVTRDEIASVVDASGLRLAHLTMRAELDAVIYSGARGTYALVDDRVAAVPALDRDDALGRLARRYFASHGPALVHDFAWWSGLTVADARRAIDVARLSSRDGYWLAETAAAARGSVVRLLPNFDEYLVAYRQRTAKIGALAKKLGTRPDLLSNHVVIVDGEVVGVWRRAPEVILALATRLAPAEQRALDAELARLARFTRRERSREPSRPAQLGPPARPRRARSRRAGRGA
jgi:hypothetical protein